MSVHFRNEFVGAIAIGLGMGLIWVVGSTLMHPRSERRQWLRKVLWGYFAPAVERYSTRRGGFARHEKFDWLVVAVAMLIVLVMLYLAT